MFRVLGLLVVVVIAYLAWPMVTMWRLGNAIATKDVVVIDSIIDWPSVRAALKADLLARPEMQEALRKGTAPGESGFAAAGSALGLALAGPIMDRALESMLNSSLVIKGYENGRIPVTPADGVSGLRMVTPTAITFSVMVGPPGEQVQVNPVMQLKDMDWRVTRVMIVDMDQLGAAMNRGAKEK